MKQDLHPTYHKTAEMKCSCGTVFVVGSTEASLSIEICSQCHPFYTGKKKVVDTMGRVDRFKKMSERADKKRAETAKLKADKKKRVSAKTPKADETKKDTPSKKAQK